MHLLNVGEILESSDAWEKLSKSEQRQRQASAKERKYRINNSNFAIHPQKLSVRNLPRSVDVTRLRQQVVQHLGQRLAPQGSGRKAGLRLAQEKVSKVSLVRDDNRREESGERRSRGFGFIAMKDHASAMQVLEILNDNPAVFGGGKRPIVEFALEDKRKLRMQQELFERHAHKLDPNAKKPAEGQGSGAGQGKGASKGEAGRGRGTGEGEGEEGWSAKRKWKHKKKGRHESRAETA